MIVEDDRTTEQKKSHKLLVVGTDSFMSGWGHAEGGASYAAWACTSDDVDRVERWVRRRDEMKRVRVALEPYRPKASYCKHFHIYVVEPGHPALS